MGLSKRCKVCSLLDESNFPIGGEYCGKLLPEVIRKVAGVELVPKRISAVLICSHCAISIIQAESTVDKLQRALNKLGKNLYSEIIAISSTASEAFKKFKIEGKSTLNESSTSKKSHAKVEKKKDKSSTTSDGNNISNNIHTDEDKKPSRDLSEEKGVAYNPPEEPTNCTEHEVNTSIKSRKRKIVDKESLHESKDLDQPVDTLLEHDSSAAKVRNCVLCNKSFTLKSELKEHIEIDHMNEKLKECPRCSMSFTSLQKYEAHVFKGKCLKMSTYICEYANCNKHFATPEKLELHIQTKHN